VQGSLWLDRDDGLPVNDPVQYRSWALRTTTGETLSAAGGIGARSALDVFLLMFPSLQLQEMRRLTNRELQAKGRTARSEEMLKYFGLLLLTTRFDFGERALVVDQPGAQVHPASRSWHDWYVEDKV
jgi:hypothetical protein